MSAAYQSLFAVCQDYGLNRAIPALLVAMSIAEITVGCQAVRAQTQNAVPPTASAPPSSQVQTAQPSDQPPQLPKELQEQVRQDEKVIGKALSNPGNLNGILAAIPKAEYVLEIRSTHQGGTWWETKTARWNLQCLRRLSGLSDEQRGQLVTATEEAGEALSLFKEGSYSEGIRPAENSAHVYCAEEDPACAACLTILGHFNAALGQYEKAEQSFTQSWKINEKAFGPNHPQVAMDLNNLAELYMLKARQDPVAYMLDLGKGSKIERWLKDALGILETAGTNHPLLPTVLNNLSMFYEQAGRYAEAEPLIKKSLDLDEKGTATKPQIVSLRLNNLALVEKKLEEYDKAEANYRKALAIAETVWSSDHPNVMLQRRNLAALLMDTKRQEQAIPLFVAAAESTEHYLARTFPVLSADQKERFIMSLDPDASDALATLTLKEGHGDPKDGLRGVLLSKQLLFEAARQESAALRSSYATASPGWRADWRELQEVRQEYATAALQAMSEVDQPQRVGHTRVDPELLDSLGNQIEHLEEHLRQTNQDYAKQARIREVKLEDVCRSLRKGDALVEYVGYRNADSSSPDWGKEHYGAFVLLGGSGKVVPVELGEAKQIDNAVNEFRSRVDEFIEQYKTNQEVTPSASTLQAELSEDTTRPGVLSETRTALASSALRKLIWDPIAKSLAGVHRLYVAPDGQLSLIPFEALAQKEQTGRWKWRYLAEENYELVYVNTGRDLARLALNTPSGDQSNTAVLIGDPDFSAQPSQLASAVANLQRPTEAIRLAGSNATLSPSDSRGSPGTLGASAVRRSHCLDFKDPRTPALSEMMQQVSQLLRESGWSVPAPLMGPRAVEEAVKGVQRPQILQLATHGCFMNPSEDASGSNPLLESMLFFAGVNHWRPDRADFYWVGSELLSEEQAKRRGQTKDELDANRVELDDGILTAYEVTGINLQGTELVNLTACQTGLGEVTPDGVVGLRESFLLAGARSLTISMWEVPTVETTHEIMDFYKLWVGGKKGAIPGTRYQAFREAQRKALERARNSPNKSGHPFYWAGVVYLGDPGDLPTVPLTN